MQLNSKSLKERNIWIHLEFVPYNICKQTQFSIEMISITEPAQQNGRKENGDLLFDLIFDFF